MDETIIDIRAESREGASMQDGIGYWLLDKLRSILSIVMLRQAIAMCFSAFLGGGGTRPKYVPFRDSTRGIRLLHVDRIDGTTRWRLVNYRDQFSCPEFVALSYTWGRSSSFDEMVSIDGRKMLVRANLSSFLKHVERWKPQDGLVYDVLGRYVLSRAYLPRATSLCWRGPFWIDALCIDQNSASEKSHQVRKMSQIYSSAETVMVWFPPDYGQIFSPDDAGRLSLVQCMLKQPYWKRVWIIQEFILARKVTFCHGGHIIGYEHFCQTLDTKPQLFMDAITQSTIRYLRAQRTSKADNKFDDHLPALFEKFQYSECDDPRDKIFALLGLAGKWAKVEANYGLQNEELFLQLLEGYHEFRAQFRRLKNILKVDIEEFLRISSRHGKTDLLSEDDYKWLALEALKAAARKPSGDRSAADERALRLVWHENR